jgi:arylsulfate sulfotransferase
VKQDNAFIRPSTLSSLKTNRTQGPVDDPWVASHTQAYNNYLAAVSSANTPANPLIIANPYGTSPLSLYLGIYIDTPGIESVDITISAPAVAAVSITFPVPLKIGPNLIPVAGLVPSQANSVKLGQPYSTEYTVFAPPLPPSDSATTTAGFPVIQSTSLPAEPTVLGEELYFAVYSGRFNVAFDYYGNVRWYTTKDIPVGNLVRLTNGLSAGHFLSTSPQMGNNFYLYEFDIVGRVYNIYLLDHDFNHSIFQQSAAFNGYIVAASEDQSKIREELGYATVMDGVSIVDLAQGATELDYFDMYDIMDTKRAPRPSTSKTGAAGEVLDPSDWLHINQCYIDEPTNLLICSARNQSAVFGVDVSTKQLKFILGNHQDWQESFQQYLLTPADRTYDFTSQADIIKADREYWTWGQHDVLQGPNSSTSGIVNISVFDDGNYRSRTDEYSVSPERNYSQVVNFSIDLYNMTVTRPFAYGRTEVGNPGYSSFVGAKQILRNGNLVVHFGGHIIDENGQTRTLDPGYSDVVETTWGSQDQAVLLLQEVDASNNKLCEITVSSGTFKDLATQQGPDMPAFRVYKMPLMA